MQYAILSKGSKAAKCRDFLQSGIHPRLPEAPAPNPGLTFIHEVNSTNPLSIRRISIIWYSTDNSDHLMDNPDLAAAAADSETFHLFSHLPPEMRFQIWLEALPEKDLPAFTPYRNGCWFPADPEHLDASSLYQDPVQWKFYHQSLDQIRVKIPLADVNHEARNIAIEWARKQGIRVITHEDRRCTIFLRPFEPMRDVIWVGGDVYEHFVNECSGIHEWLPSPEKVFLPVDIGHFAVSMHMLVDDQCLGALADVLCSFRGDIVMWIIADEHPDFNVMHGDDRKVQPRWELHDTLEGEAMIWERTSKTFEVDLHARLFEEDSIYYNRVLEGSQLIACVLGTFMPNINFEIRAARAIRL